MPRIGATIFAAVIGSLTTVWSTAIFIAEILRANSTPLISEIVPLGANRVADLLNSLLARFTKPLALIA